MARQAPRIVRLEYRIPLASVEARARVLRGQPFKSAAISFRFVLAMHGRWLQSSRPPSVSAQEVGLGRNSATGVLAGWQTIVAVGDSHRPI